jgi:drug/metabolite transporter (DMT)-like permease
MRSKLLLAYGGLLLGMIFWGSAFPASRWAVGHVPHEVAAFLRFAGGALVLVVATGLLRPERTPSRQDVMYACFAGLVGVFGYNALFFWGVSMAPASDGSVIFPALVPVLTTSFLLLTRQEDARWVRMLGLVLGVSGAAMFFLATSAHVPDGSRRLLGDVVFVSGAAVWATYTLLNRKVLTGMDPIVAVTYATISGSVALGIMALPHFGEVEWGELSGGFWANAVWLSVGPTAASYILYARGIRDAGASTASAMMFTVPVFGTFLSFVFLDESFTLAQAGGAVVMLVGAYLAVTAGQRIRPRRKAPVEVEPDAERSYAGA